VKGFLAITGWKKKSVYIRETPALRAGQVTGQLVFISRF
jgi:hypothetical protein